MLPSIKTLDKCFPGKGKLIRQALESIRFCRQHPAGQRRLAECHHPPGSVDLRLTVINDIIGGHGVEYISHRDDGMRDVYGIEYVNLGDTYITTILYDHKLDSFRCSDYGSIIERREGQYP